MKHHCKAENPKMPICPTCGENGKDCMLEIYNSAISWGNLCDKVIFIGLVLLIAFCIDKVFFP